MEAEIEELEKRLKWRQELLETLPPIRDRTGALKDSNLGQELKMKTEAEIEELKQQLKRKREQLEQL